METSNWRTVVMFEQIKQVGLTYVTHRFLWLVIGFFGILLLPNLIFAMSPIHAASNATQLMLFDLGMPMLFLMPFLVGHAKTQFAHPRAHLLPQFFPAHIAVLCSILLATFVIYPFILVRLSGFEPLGLIALSIAIGVPALWGAQLNR